MHNFRTVRKIYKRVNNYENIFSKHKLVWVFIRDVSLKKNIEKNFHKKLKIHFFKKKNIKSTKLQQFITMLKSWKLKNRKLKMVRR